jgi:hypothetical protein
MGGMVAAPLSRCDHWGFRKRSSFPFPQLLAQQGTSVSMNFSCTFSDGWVTSRCNELRGLFYIVTSNAEALRLEDAQGDSSQLSLVGNSYSSLHVQVRV